MSYSVMTCLRARGFRDLLQPLVCSSVPCRHILYRRKFKFNEDFQFLLYQKYDWTIDGVKDIALKWTYRNIYKLQMYDESQVKVQGPDQAAAIKVLELNGRVKFVHDPRWLEMKDDKMPVPTSYREGFHLEGIDASETLLMTTGLDYLYDLDHLRYMNLSNTKFTTDWFVQTLANICPKLEYLDVSSCKNITSATLEIAHTMKNLKVLNVTDCVNIKEADIVCDLLMDFVPHLRIIGVETLDTVGECLHAHERNNSRYLNWGDPAPEEYTKHSLGTRADTSIERLDKGECDDVDESKVLKSDTGENIVNRTSDNAVEGIQNGESDSREDQKRGAA